LSEAGHTAEEKAGAGQTDAGAAAAAGTVQTADEELAAGTVQTAEEEPAAGFRLRWNTSQGCLRTRVTKKSKERVAREPKKKVKSEWRVTEEAKRAHLGRIPEPAYFGENTEAV